MDRNQDKSLMLSMLGKNFSRSRFEIFFILPRIYDLTFHANCLPMETICMKCQILFSGKISICLLLNMPVACSYKVWRKGNCVLVFFHIAP